MIVLQSFKNTLLNLFSDFIIIPALLALRFHKLDFLKVLEALLVGRFLLLIIRAYQRFLLAVFVFRFVYGGVVVLLGVEVDVGTQAFVQGQGGRLI